MIRLKEIQDALFHLVGWEQSYDPDREISSALLESESGLYFQSAHPLLTLDNIENTMPENFFLQYPDWDNDTPYPEGKKVKHGGKVWIALANNVNV